jgi:hypothetical protein
MSGNIYTQPEVPNYDSSVYQYQLTDPVQGNTGGVANTPILNLANRTNWLHQQLLLLINGALIPPTVAPLNGAAFTGSTTAPNVAPGNNSTLIANTNFVQTAIQGLAQVPLGSGGTTVLIQAQWGVGILNCTGTLTSAATILFPSQPGLWTVLNQATGSYSVGCRTAGNPATVIVPQGGALNIFCDGVRIWLANDILDQTGEIVSSDLAPTGVGVGTYVGATITVGADGRITAASAGNPMRIFLTSNLTLYVNALTGSDSNPGTTSALPFKTLQAAANAMQHNYDWNGFSPTIDVANGTYSAGVTFSGPLLGTNLPIQLIGNINAPQSSIISTPTGNCVNVDGANVNVQGFTLIASGAPSNSQGSGLYCSSAGSLTFSSLIFGACTYAHIYSVTAATVTAAGPLAYTISGSSPCHVLGDVSSLVTFSSAAVTLTGTPAFSSAFCYLLRNATFQSVLGTTYTGAATGVRYLAAYNGIITSNGTVFPGSSAGSVSTGGQYS